LNKTVKKIVSSAAKLVISGIFFWIIWNKVDIPVVADYIKTANFWWLFAALLSFLTSKAISAFRLNQFYKTQELTLHPIFLLKFYLLSMFYNIFLPFLGGEGFKVLFLKKHFKASYKAMIWCSLLDRVSGVSILASLSILFFILIPHNVPYKSLLIFLIPIGLGLYFYIHKRFFNSYHGAWTKALGYSVAVQFTQLTTAFFLLLALNTASNHLSYLFVFLVASFSYIIPVIGIREFVFVYGAEILKLNMELSLTVSLFFYVSLIISSIIGIIFFLFPDWYKKDLKLSQELTASL
jgi:hypothetical protein